MKRGYMDLVVVEKIKQKWLVKIKIRKKPLRRGLFTMNRWQSERSKWCWCWYSSCFSSSSRSLLFDSKKNWEKLWGKENRKSPLLRGVAIIIVIVVLVLCCGGPGGGCYCCRVYKTSDKKMKKKKNEKTCCRPLSLVVEFAEIEGNLNLDFGSCRLLDRIMAQNFGWSREYKN